MGTSQTAASHYTLVVALVAAAISTGLYLRGLTANRVVTAARYAYYVATLTIALAFGLLTYAFLSRDFSLAYVAAYSSADLSTAYTVSAIWAGQEGSFLLWTLLALSMGVVLVRGLGERENVVMLYYNLPILALLVLLLKQSPFLMAASNGPGRGLNPLLQNPWMAIHPPAVFLGYAACGIPFAFALAMVGRKEFHRFVQVGSAWVVFAWVTMGVGIMLGGFWAYETLGWGGYWGWDPVENASLIPWLVLSASVHGLVVQRRSGGLGRFNYWMVILSFVTIVYGTFLTRSGVLQDFSVHSFADLGISGLLVFLLVAFIALSGAVYVFGRSGFKEGRKIEVGLNLPFLFTVAALLLLASAFLVCIGTSSPILTKLVGEPSKVSNEFYILTNVPICLALMSVLAISPYLEGRGEKPAAYLFALATVAVAAASYKFGVTDPVHLAMVVVTSFTLFSQLLWVGRADVAFIHAGLAMFILGSVYACGYETKDRIMLVQDQPTIWNGYEVTFRGLDVPPDGRRALRIDVRNSRMAWEAYPKLYPNPSTGQPVASPAIRRGLLTDVYLAAEQYIPGSAISNQGRNATAVVSAMKVPFINLVWLGSILATVGGIWSLLRHYARKRESAAAGGSAADPAGEEPARRAAGG